MNQNPIVTGTSEVHIAPVDASLPDSGSTNPRSACQEIYRLPNFSMGEQLARALRVSMHLASTDR